MSFILSEICHKYYEMFCNIASFSIVSQYARKGHVIILLKIETLRTVAFIILTVFASF